MATKQICRNYTVRLYPTSGQSRHLYRIVEEQRQLYIAALAERIDCFNKTGKIITQYDQQKSLTECRHDPDLSEMAATRQRIQEGTLVRLDKAFKAFFRRAKAGQPPGFPRFPGKDYWRSFQYRYPSASNKGIQKAIYQESKVAIVGVGDVVFRHGKLPKSEGLLITQAVIGHDGKGKWFATIGFKYDVTEMEDDGTLMGIDLNTGDNMIVSWDGEESSRFGRPDTDRLERDIKRLQRKLSRQHRGSNRYQITKKRLGRMKNRVYCIVKDAQHRATTELARKAYTIGTEKLQVRNMTRSAKGTEEDPGKNVKAKSGLNRVILAAAPSRTIQMISYKAGRHVEVNPKNTSRKCNACGYTAAENRKTQARFVCKSCGHTDNADRNAARNVHASAAENVASKLRGDAALATSENCKAVHKTRSLQSELVV